MTAVTLPLDAGDLAALYASLDTADLVSRQGAGTLTDAAARLLDAELARRGAPHAWRPARSPGRVAAPLGRRLGAVSIDLVSGLAFALAIDGFVHATGLSAAPSPLIDTDRVLWLLVLWFALKDGLFGGQSLGKRLLHIKVIDQRSGRPCSLLQSVTRNLLIWPGSLIDLLLVPGPNPTRFGDRIAKTVVVRSTVPVTHAAPGRAR